MTKRSTLVTPVVIAMIAGFAAAACTDGGEPREEATPPPSDRPTTAAETDDAIAEADDLDADDDELGVPPALPTSTTPSSIEVNDLAWSTGTKKLLDLRIQFPDLPSASTQDRDMSSLLEMASHYRAYSYGRTDVVPTVSARAYTLPHPAAYYATQTRALANTALMNDAIAAAAGDYTASAFDRVIVHFPSLSKIAGSNVKYGGWSQIHGPHSWLNGGFGWRLLAHEIGHSYGCYHANRWTVSNGDPLSATGRAVEYGDKFDIMGGDWANDPRLDFNEAYKRKLGWLPATSVDVVTTPGRYRISRFDDSRASGVVAIRIKKDDKTDYWIGYRRAFTDNASLSNGAYVTMVSSSSISSLLVDVTPTTGYEDAALPIGRTLSDGHVSLTPVANGGVAPYEWLDVDVAFP